MFLEKLIIYGSTGLLLFGVFMIYLIKLRKQSRIVDAKIKLAKDAGSHEPVSLHPVIDVNSCIQSGACVRACPEHDILGIRNGKATVINASRCIGHGACFHACPTQAISLYIGTEKRGVDLPHVNEYFESNVKGIYIAGEMGGMGLVKNSVEQGKQAIQNLAKKINKVHDAEYDVVIIGAGPAGIGATLMAKHLNLKAATLEQDSLGGTVYNFPRSKIIMTSSVDLPLHGKVRMNETSKEELLNLWNSILSKNNIEIKEHQKVEQIIDNKTSFNVITKSGSAFTTQKVLLAVGRRGSPRKLGIPGETLQKVAYRLLEPEFILNKKIVVVGGGDSAIESVLMLMEQNEVTLTYRGENFNRLKPKNSIKIKEAIENKLLNVILNSNLTNIEENQVFIKTASEKEPVSLSNDLVYIFAGGELPTQFLKQAGIEITTKFGEAILKHKK